MIKITLKQILTLASTINSSGLLVKELPIKVSYKLIKISKLLDTEIESYRDMYRKLILKYGEIDSDGEPIVREDGTIRLLDIDKFHEYHEALLCIEVELDFIPININELGDLDMSPEVLLNLEGIIEG